MGSIKRIFVWIFFLGVSYPFASLCQETQGIQLIEDGMQSGYVLLYDMNYNGPGPAYLIDNCGHIVNQWSVNTNYHPKLLADGSLIYPSGNGILWIDWDGNERLTLLNVDPGLQIVYEVILLGSGNLLCVGRRDLSLAESRALGFAEGSHSLRYDVVVELDPNDTSIVWEWKIIDHIIQERDTTAPNYGSVEGNPELLDMDIISEFDWRVGEQFMINGMDYNVELDQIVLSIRRMSEIIIIDHSTTTAEAVVHEGGLQNKGGDILYRWGNPQNYKRGDEKDRELYFQHNPNWIQHGEYAGSIIIFNNGLGRDLFPGEREYSSIDIIIPSMNSNGEYLLQRDFTYGPRLPNWRYVDKENPQNFYSGYTSGAEVLPNGNIFITEGIENRLFEITMDKTKVWEYRFAGRWYLFRTEKYPVNYRGLTGRVLEPGETIEYPSSNVECDIVTNTTDHGDKKNLFIVHLSKSELNIESHTHSPFNARILNIAGQVFEEQNTLENSITLTREYLPSGIYLLRIEAENSPNDIETIRFFQY